MQVIISKNNSCDFWLSHQQDYPSLSCLALCQLASPASEAFVERTFSTCGWLSCACNISGVEHVIVIEDFDVDVKRL